MTSNSDNFNEVTPFVNSNKQKITFYMTFQASLVLAGKFM